MTTRPSTAVRAGVLALTIAITTAACADSDISGGTATAGQASVLAAFYPLAFVAEQVGGSDVDVTDLTTPGVEPHDLELTPRQVGDISDADLVVYLTGFQPAVDEAVAQSSAQSLDLAEAVQLESRDGTRDPHFWLDPTKLAVAADAVAARLAASRPAHAAAFAERANTLKAQLQALDAEYRAGLAHCARTDIVTAHEAFGYLAERYGLEQVPIAGISPDEEPSAARLQEIQQLVRDRGTTTIFFETLLSRDLAETIARDTGAASAVLDPIEGIKDTATDDYFSVMRANLAALRRALSCQ